MCPICLHEPETTEHALLLCPWTRAAWFGAQIQCCPTDLSVSSFGKWLMDILGKMKLNIGVEYDLWCSKVGCLVWEMWKARNLAVHQRTSPNPTAVICKAKLMELEFAELEEEPEKHSTSVKRLGATAAVYRDPNGSLLAGINSTIVATSPLAAEALAVREALIMSRNFQMEKVIIESDNQILVQALKSHASIEAIQVAGRMVKLCLLHVRITSLSIVYVRLGGVLRYWIAVAGGWRGLTAGGVDSSLEIGTLAKGM
ncbi:uncharacterized protein LOC130981438 [Arachis stenosperma]|uniref:uncharacterized protein LOC130981438 n=1 Tax=Arachis stenosperma TaxID=217475 RepID=UPI0025AC0639|nr:uncharacterized protein LOC130981438 [Arachis stenosperma]